MLVTMENRDIDRYSVWRDYYLAIQGLFYFAQGIAMGALLFLTAFLDFLSLSAFDRIVIQAVIWAPWYLKVIFGMLSDRVSIGKYGRRKPYIFMAGIFGVIGWLTLGTHLVFGPLLVVSGILASLGTSMSDATIDALAVDITPPHKRGAMQGVSWGTRGLGVGLAVISFGWMADQNIWFIMYAIPGVIVCMSTFLVLLFKEQPDLIQLKTAVIRSELSRRHIQICLVFQLFSGAGVAILPILQTFLEEGVGYDNTTIGFIFAYFSVGMFIGSLLFGLLGDKISVKFTLSATTVLYAILIAFVIFLNFGSIETAVLFFFTVGIVNGGYDTTHMRINMDYSSTSISGTMFNLYNSISNVGMLAIGAITIATFVEIFGSYQLGWQFGWVFLFIALIPGYILVTKYSPIGSSDDDRLPIPEVPQFDE